MPEPSTASDLVLEIGSRNRRQDQSETTTLHCSIDELLSTFESHQTKIRVMVIHASETKLADDSRRRQAIMQVLGRFTGKVFVCP